VTVAHGRIPFDVTMLLFLSRRRAAPRRHACRYDFP